MFRDLFPFTEVPAEEATATTTRNLLESIAGLPPLESAALLISRAIPLIAAQSNMHMRFKLLESAREEAERVLPTLENEVTQASLPMSKDNKKAAIHADQLLKKLAMAYAEIAQSIRKHHPDSGLSRLNHRSIKHAVKLLVRRQLLAYRAYATPSPAAWQMLHELYLIAFGDGASALGDDAAPIRRDYVSALLFAYLEPGKLPRSELEIIHCCALQLAAHAMIEKLTPEARRNANQSSFLVMLTEGNPGYPANRLPEHTGHGEGLIIDCTEVLAALDRNLHRQPGKVVEPDLDLPSTLLQSMRLGVGGKNIRRHGRTKLRPRADLVGGLSSVISFVAGNAYSRRSHDTLARNDATNFTVNEWWLFDESPNGFRIRFSRGKSSPIGVGEVVALQPREASNTHLCLVRRIATTSSYLELGLQLLSSDVSVVNTIPDGAAPCRALFLQSLPAHGDISGLIAPPGKVRSGQKITFDTLTGILHRKIGKPIEANDGLEFFALDALLD